VAHAPVDDGIERYRIVRELGRGGMGIVYEAEDLSLGRRVALKVLGPAAGGSERRAQLVREARAAARLDHPGIAAVYDATPDYLAMQLVDGHPLSECPRDDRRRLVALVRDAATAVQHAHERGIVHRDLKPSNLLVQGDRVYVTDFGLAKDASADVSLSTPGGILGTPGFLPPEQAWGRTEEVDARSDVYALGATLHACLVGSPPFVDTDLVRCLRRVLEEDPKPMRVDTDLDAIVLRCLAKERERRYPTAEALARDLDRWLRGEPVTARRGSRWERIRRPLLRRRRVLVAAIAVVAAGAALWIVTTSREQATRQMALELSRRTAFVERDVGDLRRLGDMSKANRLLDDAIAECDALLASRDLAEVHQLRARLLRTRGRIPDAIAALDRALAIDPRLPGARLERTLLDVDSRPDAASELASQAVDELPRVEQLFARAERARLLGDFESARRLLEDVLQRDPAHVPATLSLARVALAQGDDARALSAALSAVSLQRAALER